MGFPALVEIHLDAVVADKRPAHFPGWLPVPNPAVGSLLVFKLTGNARSFDVLADAVSKSA